MLAHGSYAACVAAETVVPPAPHAHSARRMRLVVQGAAAAMALVVAAAAASGATQGRARWAALAQTVPMPNITKVVGPSEAMWMKWEDAHGLPKECTPAKEVTIGPHGEDVVTYYADCSMVAKDRQEERARLRATRAKQGRVALAHAPTAVVKAATSGSKPFDKTAFQAKVRLEAAKLMAHDARVAGSLSVDPDIAAAKKAKAQRAIAAKAAAITSAASPNKVAPKVTTGHQDKLEPPKLPAMLAAPNKPEAVAKPPTKTVALRPQSRKMRKASAPETPAQKVQHAFFAQRVKAEEAKLWANDQSRSAQLVVDPDANVANGPFGSMDRSAAAAAPKPHTATLYSKATGPAASVLQLLSDSSQSDSML